MVRDLECPVDFVLGRVVGAFRALRKIAGAREPKRQLVLDPMREHGPLRHPHRPKIIEITRWLPSSAQMDRSQILGQMTRTAAEDGLAPTHRRD